jgi:hypothetical protein
MPHLMDGSCVVRIRALEFDHGMIDELFRQAAWRSATLPDVVFFLIMNVRRNCLFRHPGHSMQRGIYRPEYVKSQAGNSPVRAHPQRLCG